MPTDEVVGNCYRQERWTQWTQFGSRCAPFCTPRRPHEERRQPRNPASQLDMDPEGLQAPACGPSLIRFCSASQHGQLIANTSLALSEMEEETEAQREKAACKAMGTEPRSSDSQALAPILRPFSFPELAKDPNMT